MKHPIPFFSLEQQSKKLADSVLKQLSSVIEKTAFVGMAHNPFIQKFEKEFSTYIGCNHTIACNSGTDALWMALSALELKEDSIVLTTPFSFISSSSEIVDHRAHPVFIDIEEKTYNIDPKKLEDWLSENALLKNGKSIEKTTGKHIAGIVTVDIFGQCADYIAIKKIADAWNLWIVEDACQAVGASLNDKKTGLLGDISCFSFYPTKNLGAWGDAGAATTNNPALAEKIVKIRNIGRASVGYAYECYGKNSRLDAFQAVVLSEKLPMLEDFNNRRREIAHIYQNEIGNLPFLTCPKEEIGHHVYHQFSVIVKDEKLRNALKEHLTQHNIGTNIFYPQSLNQIPYLQTNAQLKTNCSIAEKTANSILALPIWPELTNEEVALICECIKNFKP